MSQDLGLLLLMILHPCKFKKLVVYTITMLQLIPLPQQVLYVYTILYSLHGKICKVLYNGRIKYSKNVVFNRSDSVGSRNGETQSYSNVISRAESNISSNAPKTNELGKKGKKPSRVLLSTAGGRRY